MQPEGIVQVSVVMPMYNGSATIERAVASVIGQDFDDWELIIVDDCSTDDGPELVQRIIDSDRALRIKLLRQSENAGPSAARNAGLAAASGEFLSFVDCDDELLPSGLSVLVSAMRDDLDLVAAAHLAATVDGVRECRPDRMQGLASGAEILDAALQGKMWNYLHGKLYRSRIFEQVRFPAQLVRYEDLVVNACAYSYSRNVLVIDDPVYVYHVQPESLTWSQQPSLDYIKGTVQGVQDGINPAARGKVAQRSWDSLRAFLGVMTYSGGLFATDSAKANRQIVEYLRSELSWRALVGVARSWSLIGCSALLIKVSPQLYSALYRWHVRRTFGMSK
ncbi:glycosyltransferase family 2 protein [Arthrobacter russicus]|uniref:Glycosyltransferase 2-like domain-containing protein n=1 Tax=Arthrobacter russicus TaxID=172040 RepID=A0ABU1J821_9MICC|nr:glycosyltransferase family 2 protein [Arthrobacter russicus]MDR6268565.1 hypothetical protein [Arthrobacter russicus]